VVQDLRGANIPSGSMGTLNFGADGTVSGRSFCNSFRGNYTLTGEGLSISLLATTLMGCAPEIMASETVFTDLLARVQRFAIERDGALILEDSEGRAMGARREPSGL
jgi:heat shock protein HslJ